MPRTLCTQPYSPAWCHCHRAEAFVDRGRGRRIRSGGDVLRRPDVAAPVFSATSRPALCASSTVPPDAVAIPSGGPAAHQARGSSRAMTHGNCASDMDLENTVQRPRHRERPDALAACRWTSPWIAGPPCRDLPVFNPPDPRHSSSDGLELGVGDAFIALAGDGRTHGLKFAAKARAAKVAAIVFGAAGAGRCRAAGQRDRRAPVTATSSGEVANRFLRPAVRRPMPVAGITGTNGKTSTVQLIAMQAIAQPRPQRGHDRARSASRPVRPAYKRGERTTPDVIAVHTACWRPMRGRRGAPRRWWPMECRHMRLGPGRVDERGVRHVSLCSPT